MRAALFALALLPLTAIGACHASWEKEGHKVTPSGVGAKRSYDASGFTKVDLRGPDDIEVRNGGQFAVTAEGDTAVLDQLEVRVVDGTLRVGRKDRNGFTISNDRGVKVHVVLPKLDGASVSGSGNMSIDKAEGAFRGAIAGSGNLGIAALAATDADLSIAGSGDIDASKLTATGASISIIGSGSLRGVVKGGASVSIAGSGDVDLTGGAKCSVSAVGSGEAHCS